MQRDLRDPRWMYLKATLLVLVGLLASAALLIQNASLRNAATLAIAVWGFCRAYYFAFYVVQHYIEPGYRFSSLLSFIRHLAHRTRSASMPVQSQGEAMSQYPYATHLDIAFEPLELIDLPALVSAVKDQWFNQTLCKVNDSVVRLGVMQGEYHWHKHDDLDEFFFTLDGTFLIDLEDKTIELSPRKGFVVPKGVMHRTRAPEKCVILMVEGAGIVPTGD